MFCMVLSCFVLVFPSLILTQQLLAPNPDHGLFLVTEWSNQDGSASETLCSRTLIREIQLLKP